MFGLEKKVLGKKVEGKKVKGKKDSRKWKDCLSCLVQGKVEGKLSFLLFVWMESDKERKRYICEMTKLTLYKY